MQEEKHLMSEQENYFLNTFPLIRRITLGKLRGACREQAEDLAQVIGLNLWRWRVRRDARRAEAASLDERSPENNQPAPVSGAGAAEKEELTQEEWLKLANTAARHAVSSFYRRRYRREAALAEELTLQMTELAAGRPALTARGAMAVEGNSRAEIASLLCKIWEIIDSFPVTRKYSYLLGKEELIINFITHGCATRKELAASLGITVPELDEVISNLPLPDENIRQHLERRRERTVSLRQVWTWRAKAKAKLAEKLQEFI